MSKSINSDKKELAQEQREELFRVLKARFEKNMNRHSGLEWAKVQARLETNAAPSLLITDTVMFSCITTALNHTLPPGDSVAR